MSSGSAVAKGDRVAVSGTQALGPRRITPSDVQRAFDAFNRSRWVLDDDAPESELENRNREIRHVEAERTRVRRAAAEAPTDPDAFVAWFEDLETTGPGQRDPLFDWLATDATHEQVTWVVRQESAIADLSCADGPDAVPEARALAHLLSALRAHRRYAYACLGALRALALTAPGREAKIIAGLRRIGAATPRIPGTAHARVTPSLRPWNPDELRALIASDGRLARPLAEGALMRLEAGARCFDRYRWDLWGATI
jgi:hypothetical protein